MTRHGRHLVHPYSLQSLSSLQIVRQATLVRNTQTEEERGSVSGMQAKMKRRSEEERPVDVLYVQSI